MTNKARLDAILTRAKSGANRVQALLYRLRVGAARRWPEIIALVFTAAFAASLVAMVLFATPLARALGGNEAMEPVADLLLQMGAALIGATTIAFTLVMFAMQVNVERMPYGLFRRFSADLRLMGAFGLTFMLSISIAAASVVRSAALVPWLLFGLTWATLTIFGLFLVAYRRALKLISPAEQLGFVVRSAQRNLAWWDRRAALAARRHPLKGAPPDSNRDHTRIAFFLANRGWTEVARKSVEHAVAYARRYAEAGDYDVCLVAWNGVVAIHRSYIRAKGLSFVSTSPFFEIPEIEDGFLTHSLEELRQYVDVALARADERQARLALEAFATLCSDYAAVDYGRPQVMTHAHLTLGYLAGAVQSVIPRGMTDVVMAGTRYIGQASLRMIAHDGALDATSGIEALGAIGQAMAGEPDTSPAAQTAVGQLAAITSLLLLSPPHRGRLAFRSTVEAVMRVSHAVLALKGSALGRIHSTTLAAYFGLTSVDGLVARLNEFTNGTFDERADPGRVAAYAEALLEWVEVLREPLKSLLLSSVMMRSSLTFDLVAWIAQAAEVLLGVATVDQCPDGSRRRLEREGIGLGQLFTWLPEERSMVEHADHSGVTERLFEMIVMARRRNSDRAVVEFGRILLGWGFKGCAAGQSWSVLERALVGLAALSLKPDGPYDPDALKLAVHDQISRRAGVQSVYDETADGLRHDRVRSSSLDTIGNFAEDVSPDQLGTLLREIADLLSPPSTTQTMQPPMPS